MEALCTDNNIIWKAILHLSETYTSVSVALFQHDRKYHSSKRTGSNLQKQLHNLPKILQTSTQQIKKPTVHMQKVES